MSILAILVPLIIVGVLLWGVNQIPMDPWVKQIVYVVAVVAIVIWVLQAFVGHTGVPTVRP